MIFVPLPLFATLLLSLGVVYFLRTRDMGVRPNRLFAALVALYAVQSLLLSLRWGYGVEALRPVLAALAPVLPALAWLAFRSLAGHLDKRRLWPLASVPLAWAIQLFGPADLAIVAIYLAFGAGLMGSATRSADTLALATFNTAGQTRAAMALTGAGLIGAAAMDGFVIVDFIFAGGRHVGDAVAMAQGAFVLGLGLAGLAGRSGHEVSVEAPVANAAPASVDCEDVVARITALFDTEGLHRDEDLNLRRLARRLALPDRQVSNAINRCHGMSVSRFVNARRIEDACRMLRETDQSVLQVSLASGFSTKSNFNREFTRITGTSPTAWRASS